MGSGVCALAARWGSTKSTRLRAGGVYLITGGLGNIGLEFAEALSERVQAKLVLIGRSQFPERADVGTRLTSNADDEVNRKIRRLLKMEELGSEVLVLRADLADRRQMAAAVAEAYTRFGVIHGVIHGAGNTTGGGFTDARHTDRAAATEHFRPKAQGLFVLEELFRDRDLDFVLLLSSLSGVLGGLGLLSYSAANIFLDAFASASEPVGPRALDQRELGRLAVSGAGGAVPPERSAGGRFPLSRRRASSACSGYWNARPGQIVVSTSDLKARIDKWIRLESVRRKPAAQREPPPEHCTRGRI